MLRIGTSSWNFDSWEGLVYSRSVPEAFLFTVKVPNSITLTHHYQRNKSKPLRGNPHFLSPELFTAFLERIEPLGDRIGDILDAIGRLLGRGADIFLNVNNHYEGSAPLTIRKIRERWKDRRLDGISSFPIE